jgi:hypothetical protein
MAVEASQRLIVNWIDNVLGSPSGSQRFQEGSFGDRSWLRKALI